MPLSVDVKEVALVPNSAPGIAVKALLGPHVDEAPAVLCARVHSLLPPTFQMVIPFLSPVTLHLKVKVSPGQVGRGALNCPVTSPACEHRKFGLYKINQSLHTTLGALDK